MQLYPRSTDLVCPGHLHGTGCLSARAVGTGFPTVVRRLCLGPGCGWVWVLLSPPVLAGVLGRCVWARFVVLSLFCRLFVVFVVELRFRPAYGTCVVSCALRLPPAVSGSGVRCGRACRAPVSAVRRPSWLGSGGVFFALFFCLALWCRLLGVPVPGLVVPVPPSLFFRAGLLALFLLWCASACFGVPFSGGPLFLAWCCRFGWVAPLCLFGGPVFCAFWVGGLAASCGVGGRFGGCGLFSRPPPSPPVFFFWGGACLLLPLPSLGWRTHWPACSVVFRAAVGSSVFICRVPAPWVGWAMYTLGSAPLPAGLGPGPAGWAAAPGGCVWL